MLYSVGVPDAQGDLIAAFLIEPVEIIAQVLATCLFHFLVQLENARIYSSGFIGLTVLFQSVAEEPPPLCQVVESSSQSVPVLLQTEVQPFMQADMPVMIGVLVVGIVGP